MTPVADDVSSGMEISIMRRLVILGGSHTVALKSGLAASPNIGGDAFLCEAHWIKAPEAQIDPGDLSGKQAIELVATLDADDVVVVTIMGTAHNIVGLLRHPEPFDVMMDESDAPIVADGVAIVPANAMIGLFESHAVEKRMVENVKKFTKASVFHLATPPPKENIEAFAHPAKEYRGRVIGEAGITPAALRLKLWLLEMKAIRNVCRRWGVGAIDSPDAARDSKGFLRPEYFAKDMTHANDSYGSLVVREIVKAMSAPERATPPAAG